MRSDVGFWPLAIGSWRITVTMGLLFLTAVGCGKGDPRFQQYFIEGEQLYKKNCSNCHQVNGKGLGLVYPPLAPSDFMDKNFEAVICLMKKGGKGEMVVNGKNFNKPMPGIPLLTELEIAEIATYIYNSWGHEKGLIEVKDVNRILQPCLTK